MTSLSESSSFSPTSVSGCKLWLDAADTSTFIMNGSNISSWIDKTGNGFNVIQASAGSQPTRDTNSVVFGYSSTLQFSGSVGIHENSYTAYMIYKCQIVESGINLLDCRDSTTGYMFVNIQFFSWTASAAAYSRAWTPTQNITILGFNNTPAFIYNKSVNGSSFSPGGDGWSPNGAASYFRIGGFPGNIYECLLYTRSVTSAEHNQITGYLAWKWSVQNLLPVGHPNYSVNGFPSPPFPLFALPTSAFRASTNPALFSPTSIAGCQLWLDAADTSSASMTLSGNNVSVWKDKSGTGNNAVGTVPPTYDSASKYVLFNGSTQYFTLPDGTYPFGNTPYSIFIVAYTRNAGNPQWVVCGGGESTNQALGLLFYYTNAVWHSWWINEYRFDNSITNNVPAIVNISYATSRSIIVNGGTASVNNAGSRSSTNSPNFIGRRPGGQFFDGGLAECIVFNSEISVFQRQQVEGYLAWKWGIQGSLPVGHPNYSVNGTVVGPFPLSVLPTTPFKIQLLPFNVTTTFTYTGADQTYVVPANITRITVYMWAAGGQGTTTINGSFYGGAGAYVEGVLAVTPGETLTIYVGQRGTPGPTFAYKNGGYNSAGDLGTGTAGGRSGIARSSTNIVAVGAGGGGGGNGNGGAGGISSGSAGTGTNPGGGGTQSAGGTAASSSYNSGGVGQNFGGGTGPGAYGGSGGDGFYGGGGGAAFGSGQLGGGGGGGSSLTSNLTSLVTFVSSNGYSAPNTSSPYYTSNIAAGGLGTSGTAGNGLVVILYSN